MYELEFKIACIHESRWNSEPKMCRRENNLKSEPIGIAFRTPIKFQVEAKLPSITIED